MAQQQGLSGSSRASLRGKTLEVALRKRSDGVPTFTVPEAAALLSVSQEYLYRLVKAGSFPSVQLRLSIGAGRYVIPARAVEQLLDDAVGSSSRVEASAYTSERWTPSSPPGSFR